MTSPALRTMTVSPGRTSFSATWSWLCSVAICTVDPPTNTGSSTANGVVRPVRPTDTSMLRKQRGPFLRGKLESDCPARSARSKPQPFALTEVVDLDDHPVDVVAEVMAMILAKRAILGDLFDRVEHSEFRIHRKPQSGNDVEGVLVTRELGPTDSLRPTDTPRTTVAAWQSSPGLSGGDCQQPRSGG